MAEVVFLSDNTSAGFFGISRYIGPYVLASGLSKAGISTHVVDYISRCDGLLERLGRVITSKTLVVGISTTFMTPLETVAGLSRSNSERIDSAYRYNDEPVLFEDFERLERWLVSLRVLLDSICPKAKIVMGGAKLQFLFDRPAEFRMVDYLVFGAADVTLREFVFDLRKDREPKEVEFKSRKVLVSLDTTENRECPSVTWRHDWGIEQGEALPIEISRGCIFNCKFCHYDKKESIRKSIEHLRRELIFNFENFGTRNYHFCDDCFNDHPEKVRAVCQSLIDLPFPIEWVSYVRVDVAVKFPDTVDLMVKSGARGLFWGLESFNYEAARRAGKGTPPEKVQRFLKDFYQRHGDMCTSSGSFIVGLPGETEQSQRETMDWVVNERALHFIDVLTLKLRPYYSGLDKIMTDFADYTRNPQKYGFQEVGFNPPWWSHETMNSAQAYALTHEFNERWRASDSTRRGLTYSIWTHPHLRGLGFSGNEVREIQTSEAKKGFYRDELKRRFEARLERYHRAVLRQAPSLS